MLKLLLILLLTASSVGPCLDKPARAMTTGQVMPSPKPAVFTPLDILK
jgi:hypothetical protein